jgi:hypothetical protein
MKYETIGGQVTQGETYRKLMDHLREAQECAAALSHLTGMNDEKLLSQGWVGISEMFKLIQGQVTKLATKGLQ